MSAHISRLLGVTALQCSGTPQAIRRRGRSPRAAADRRGVGGRVALGTHARVARHLTGRLTCCGTTYRSLRRCKEAIGRLSGKCWRGCYRPA